MQPIDRLKQFTQTLRPYLRASAQAYARAFGASRTRRLVSVSALFFAVCAFGAASVAPMAPDAADLPVRTLSQTLELPDLEAQIEALDGSAQHFVQEERIKRGDTLATLLQRLGVDDEDAERFIKTDATAKALMQARPGKVVRVHTDEEGGLEWLTLTQSEGADKPARTLQIRRSADGQFQASEGAAALERRIEMRSGTIRSSLFAATDEANIPDAVASQIVSMFETNIDFRMLQKGDFFNIVYETFWLDGEPVRTGRVLAGEFQNAGKLYQSVWYEEGAGQGGYYSFDGQSLKKAFLKSPLEFTRISSGFSMRLHPISGQWKMHKGIDFAAATGTPIRAAADGVVESAGSSRGYGNLVTIKHWANISTAYGHMSRFAPGIHKGSKVRQGEVIGYVGTTGWSTGPHLHYEFRVNNEARDPKSVSTPAAPPLAGAALQRFKQVAGDMSHRFALLRPGTAGGAPLKLAAR